MLEPNALGKTISISHGQNFRFGEGTGSLASALVLRSDAENVRQRSYSRESADALAGTRVGRRRHGSCPWPQTTSLTALHSTGKSSGRGARRLPILNRRQFCRGQKGWLER